MSASIFDFKGKPQQKAFFLDKQNKTIGAGGGYNSGKSFAMLGKIAACLEMFPGSMAIVGRKTYGALEKSVIPTYESIALKRNGGSWQGPVISKFADMTVHYKNGSKLWFVTYDDVKKVRGPNIAFAGISQAEEVAHEIFLELKGRCRQWNPESIAEFKRVHGERLMEELGYVPTPFNQLMCEFNPAPNWVRDEFFFNENGANKFYDLPTAENAKYHAEGWMEDMKKSYTKENYDRFINGSWDVFGGMVYPDFDIKGLHGIPDMVIPVHWPRIVGWDHGYRNPTAVEVAAVDEMGNAVFYKEWYADNVLVKEHAAKFKEMASGDKFPVGNNEKFLVYMDYSAKNADGGGEGKTIWDEYNELGIFGLTPDKDIPAGINMVKSYLKADPERPFPAWHPRAGQLGSPKMFIIQSACPNLVNEMQTYQWEETKEGAEKNHQERPKKWNDHACFVAGTKIATEHGPKNIETINIGERVWTRRGLKKVLLSGPTGYREKIFEVCFSNGASFKVTGNHPVWIENAGFVRVDALRYGMKALTLEETWNANHSFTMASSIIAEKASDISRKLTFGFTEKFGKMLTALYQKAIMSITRTEIEPTTNFRTWNAYLLANTMTCTSTTGPKGTRLTWPESASLQKSGTPAKKVERGIGNTALKQWRKDCQRNLSAVIAPRNSKHAVCVPAFAPTNASPLGAGLRAWITLKKNALSVLKSLSKANTANKEPVAAFVAGVSLAGKGAVYNLTVEDCPEYFAEGILVHNCDSSRYLILALGNRMAEWILPPPTPEKIGAIAAKAIAQSAFKEPEPEDEYGIDG